MTPDLRFLQTCCWRLESSGMWWFVAGRIFPDVQKDHSAFIFRVKHTSWMAWPWKWRHCDPSEHQELLSQQNSVTLQKAHIFVLCNFCLSHHTGPSIWRKVGIKHSFLELFVLPFVYSWLNFKIYVVWWKSAI